MAKPSKHDECRNPDGGRVKQPTAAPTKVIITRTAK